MELTPKTDPIYAGDQTGNKPEVTSSLEDKGRVIANVNQAFAVCNNLIYDWKKGITNAARITSKLNGERPYNQKKLKDAGKDWKTNISTGFLATECARILPRLFMPLFTAKYLTAAALPPGWDGGTEKTEFFRQVITETIRSWPKFNYYVRGMSREVGIFGFGFNTFLEQYDWRPSLVRMDKGFVPMGTEIMEKPAFFMCKYDYQPQELLKLLKSSIDSERKEWQKDNVIKALNQASVPVNGTLMENARSYQELIRQAAWIYNYSKGEKVIRTWHLYAQESSGKVSHYILLADNGTRTQEAGAIEQSGADGDEDRLLYENLDQFESMDDVVVPMVFDYGDGTIHGSWGAGQILYDLAAQVEKIRCDAIDNMRMTNKIKAQVPDAKNVNDVKLTINDQMMIISGAQFAGNMASMPQDVEGYEKLDQRLAQLAQEKIGAFVPPIPLQPSDIKAAQVNAAMSKEKELQESMLENWLIQFAKLIKVMSTRLCDKESTDETAKKVREILLEKMNEEEVQRLAQCNPIRSVMDFTELKAVQRAQFAASVLNNPLFKQNVVARIMADGIGDQRFVEAIVLPEGDQTDQIKATHDQMLENSAMALGAGQNVPVLVGDMDWIHMQQMKPALGTLLKAGNSKLGGVMLQHYAAHYTQGVSKKQIPKDQINEEKGWIAAADKLLVELQKRDQMLEHQKQMEQVAMAQAHKMIAEGHPAAMQPQAPPAQPLEGPQAAPPVAPGPMQ